MSDRIHPPAFPYGPMLACAIGYTLFVVYASFVPLHYQPLAGEDAVDQFREILRRPISYQDWADWATNIVLFIPLAFLWTGYIKRSASRRQTLGLVIIIAICGAILSTAIEFLQLWFPPRDSSLNDIVAETIGAVIGGGLWLFDNGMIATIVASFITAAMPVNKVQWLLFSYCLILACIAVMPLERSFTASHLFQDFHEGKIAAVPFGYQYASPIGLSCSVLRDALCFAPVGAYLASCRILPGKSQQPVWAPVLLGMAFVAVLELMQLIVYARVFSAIGLVAGSTGVALGNFGMRRRMPDKRRTAEIEPSISWVIIGLFLFGVVAATVVLEQLASR